MYVEQDRVWVRKYVGYAAIWIQAEPRLENAITATQSIADGGSRPDSSTENYIKGVIYGFAAVTSAQAGVTPNGSAQNGAFNTPALRGLVQIDQTIAQQDVFLGASSADGGEVEIDPVVETMRLKQEGRRLCNQLARMLGMRGVRADIFASAPKILDADPWGYAAESPFHTTDLLHWRRW